MLLRIRGGTGTPAGNTVARGGKLPESKSQNVRPKSISANTPANEDTRGRTVARGTGEAVRSKSLQKRSGEDTRKEDIRGGEASGKILPTESTRRAGGEGGNNAAIAKDAGAKDVNGEAVGPLRAASFADAKGVPGSLIGPAGVSAKNHGAIVNADIGGKGVAGNNITGGGVNGMGGGAGDVIDKERRNEDMSQNIQVAVRIRNVPTWKGIIII
jgi:hypothetical protein